jgi:hypothetical protein
MDIDVHQAAYRGMGSGIILSGTQPIDLARDRTSLVGSPAFDDSKRADVLMKYHLSIGSLSIEAYRASLGLQTRSISILRTSNAAWLNHNETEHLHSNEH